jgi:CDGSH-type Zn-finger protein
MKPENETSAPTPDFMKITVTRNGPYIVSGAIPLLEKEICNDAEGNCRTWKTAKVYPVEDTYALCRCGHSENKPFCDGTHGKIGFNGTGPGISESPRNTTVIRGPDLTLTDDTHLCVHARFCMRAGGIWDLVQSEEPGARETAIEEACNCPSGRLVLRDNKTGEVIEPALDKSIVLIEYPAKGEHGPLWVRGGIPVISADGKPYPVRNRVTLCRCGKSGNKPFCDGSHIRR